MAYKSADAYIGSQDLATVDTSKRVPLLAEIKIVDPTYGEGKAVYLAIPAATAIPAGTIVYANASGQAVVVPAVATSKKTGRQVYVAMAAVASDATNVQYAWFMRKGFVSVLKTAVTCPADQPLYISTTVGRFYLTASAGAQILGARTANAASVTSTTSSVLVILDNPKLQGFA